VAFQLTFLGVKLVASENLDKDCYTTVYNNLRFGFQTNSHGFNFRAQLRDGGVNIPRML
jgi:hypothetical protein